MIVTVHRNDGQSFTFECHRIENLSGTLVLQKKDDKGYFVIGEFAPGEWAYWFAIDGSIKTEK